MFVLGFYAQPIREGVSGRRKVKACLRFVTLGRIGKTRFGRGKYFNISRTPNSKDETRTA